MNNKEITDKKEIEDIINSIPVCHIAIVDNEMPYSLPFNFGYKDNVIYLHSGKGGRKYEILQKNNNICISMERDSILNIRHENVACSYSMKFKSVIIFGKVIFLEDFDEKCTAMNIIMKHYSGRDHFKYNAPAINNVEIYKVEIEKITARKRGY